MSHIDKDIIPHVEWDTEGIQVLLDYMPADDATPEEVRTAVRQIAAVLFQYLADINPTEPESLDDE